MPEAAWWTIGVFFGCISLTAVATGLLRSLLAKRLIVHPNERSSHHRATPTGGGLAPLIMLLIVFPVLAGTVGDHVPWSLVAVVAATGVLGFVDDCCDLPASIRFPIQGGLCFAAVQLVGVPTEVICFGFHLPLPTSAITAVAVLALWWCLNLTNFMDGIDGIAVGQSAIVAATFAVVASGDPEHRLLALTLLAVSLGFLGWNLPPARLFLGDVGSTVMGLLIGLLLLDWLRQGIDMTVAILPFFPFLADATTTLVRRLLRGENPIRAHRSHLYQRLARRWEGHGPVTAVYCLLAAIGGIGAWLAITCDLAGWPFLAVQTAGFGILAIHARIDQIGPGPLKSW